MPCPDRSIALLLTLLLAGPAFATDADSNRAAALAELADTDGDGVADVVELASPAGPDADADGWQDHLQPDRVALPIPEGGLRGRSNYVTMGGGATRGSPAAGCGGFDDVRFVDFSEIPVSPPARLLRALDGVLSIRIADCPWFPLQLTMPHLGVPVEKLVFFAYGAGHDDSMPAWHRLPAAAGHDRATLLLQDGGVGDLGAAGDLHYRIAVMRER